jgi:hypothetical protein
LRLRHLPKKNSLANALASSVQISLTKKFWGDL